ncbi:Periplasmic chelated iron-binding protein YfeA [Firmicutes bacterium ASF500]|nr:Periplasmic chelated iron-binding protein YfeA [Firmicutes bacterium ASF500]
MKRPILLALLAALLLSLPGCGAGAEEGPRLTVVCTTYPIYLFTSFLTEGVEGVAVERLDTGSTSCLHDYTLSMADMKKLEKADVIALNGAGLEEFLEDALQTSAAQVTDCSVGVDFLENLSHHHDEDGEDGHDHGHWDPHYWMDPDNARIMVKNLRNCLVLADPDHAAQYEENRQTADGLLERWGWEIEHALAVNAVQVGVPAGLITFHDGFQYFARAFGLPLLAAIEEEAGSEASAHEIVEIAELVRERDIPVIFTEVNGSDATAQAISRETGCRVLPMTMLMDGPDGGLEQYRDGLRQNAAAIAEGFWGMEVVW